jgi:hypothetical protein
MLGPAVRVQVVKGGEKDRRGVSPAPRRKPDWDVRASRARARPHPARALGCARRAPPHACRFAAGASRACPGRAQSSKQDLTVFRLSPEEARRRKELAQSAHLAEAREDLSARLNTPASVPADALYAYGGADGWASPASGHGGEFEAEATKALDELSRVQAELLQFAPRAGAAGAGVAAEAAELYRRAATARADFSTPSGGAGSRARRAASAAAEASAASAPVTPRVAEATTPAASAADPHGRAPDRLGLSRVEHAAASLAEKVKDFEKAQGGKAIWRNPGTPGGASGGAARPRSAGAQPPRSPAANAGYGGYTEMLVEMATKLLGYLNEAETRVKAEETARRKIATDFEKRLAALEKTAADARDEAARAHAELDATRASHGATLDALVQKVRAFAHGGASRAPAVPRLACSPRTDDRAHACFPPRVTSLASMRSSLACAQVTVLEHASGHAHITSLFAALQSPPMALHPAPHLAQRAESSASTPVRVTAWAPPPSAASGGSDLSSWGVPQPAAAHGRWSPAGLGAGSQALSPYSATHRVPSAAASAPREPAGANAEASTSAQFSKWPLHAPSAPPPTVGEAFIGAAQRYSPIRAEQDSACAAVEHPAWSERTALAETQAQPAAAQPQARPRVIGQPPAGGPMARMMLQQAEAAQLRARSPAPAAPKAVGASAAARGTGTALRDSTNAQGATAAAGRRVQATKSPNPAGGRAGVSQREIGV